MQSTKQPVSLSSTIGYALRMASLDSASFSERTHVFSLPRAQSTMVGKAHRQRLCLHFWHGHPSGFSPRERSHDRGRHMFRQPISTILRRLPEPTYSRGRSVHRQSDAENAELSAPPTPKLTRCRQRGPGFYTTVARLLPDTLSSFTSQSEEGVTWIRPCSHARPPLGSEPAFRLVIDRTHCCYRTCSAGRERPESRST